MKHPNEATLALHAGGDLGFIARWICREELAAFTDTREMIGDLAEVPELPWRRLEAEMKANIRLGLAAGECVRMEPARNQHGWFSFARAAVACASVAVLLASSLLLERPHPRVAQSRLVVVESTSDGIQMSDGGQALGLSNSGARNVIYSAGAQGNMGARYVDANGYVTVNNLYAQ